MASCNASCIFTGVVDHGGVGTTGNEDSTDAEVADVCREHEGGHATVRRRVHLCPTLDKHFHG
jgi:hypothetical protein